MKTIFGKKQVLMAALVAALGLAVYLNYFFAGKQPDTAAAGNVTASTAATTTTRGNLGDSEYVDGGTVTDTLTTETAVAGLAYFTDARTNRQNARDEAIGILQETLGNVKSTDAMKADAVTKITAISNAVQQESNIESLIKAKGFADCVIYIDGDNCNVAVQSNGLSPAQALQITDIITAQSPVTAGNINIVTVNS